MASYERKDEKTTYAKLGGQQQTLDEHANIEQYVTFDFMVTLSQDILSTDKHLQTAIRDSVDCELQQIRDLIINEIADGSKNKQSRVKGKIYTDDWELPILQKKFEKIISDRVLSGKLQSICALEDRPMIRRFFCKTSRQQREKREKEKGANDLEEAHKTDSFRTSNDDAIKKIISTPKSKVTAVASPCCNKSEGNKKNDTVHDDDDQCECFCVVL